MHEQDIGFFAPEYQTILGKKSNFLVPFLILKQLPVFRVSYFHSFVRMKSGQKA